MVLARDMLTIFPKGQGNLKENRKLEEARVDDPPLVSSTTGLAEDLFLASPMELH